MMKQFQQKFWVHLFFYIFFFYITYTLYNNKYVNSIGFWEIDKLGKWRNTLREQCRFCDFLFGPPALRI